MVCVESQCISHCLGVTENLSDVRQTLLFQGIQDRYESLMEGMLYSTVCTPDILDTVIITKFNRFLFVCIPYFISTYKFLSSTKKK